MITSRMNEIFKCIVEEFIATAEPIGSKTLVEKYGLPYSTATIRNEMAALEDAGLLEKTHTSSGRIPSTVGYRYYVEHFLEKRIDQDLALTIETAFNTTLNTSDTIRKTCDVLSQMTNLTAMVLGPDAQQQRLKNIKLFPIDDTSAVAVFITNTGHTENRMFRFDEAVSVQDIQLCCDILNDRLEGTLISDIVNKMESLRPILASAVERHEILFRAFVNAFAKFASENVYLSGEDKLLYHPEFADIERLKEMMGMLENSSVWRSIGNDETTLMLRKNESSQLFWKGDMAVVSSSFHLNDAEEAQLMLVGPSRMDYDSVVNLMEFVTSTVEKILNRGGKNGR